MKVGFIIDPLDQLKSQTDSSLLMMVEATLRRHRVYVMQAQDLQYELGQLSAKVEELKVWRDSGDSSTSPRFERLDACRMELKKFDVILIRKNPPFDSNYLYLTQLLDLVADKVWIINSPAGLRAANEKLFILNFPQLIPPTLVTSELSEAKKFWQAVCHNSENQAMVMKPLHLFGGEGVTAIRLPDINSGKFEQLFLQLSGSTEGGKFAPVMLQPMLHAERGDKRIIVINGKPEGAVLRIPKAGEFRANLRHGASVAKTEISRREKKICATISTKLVSSGLELAGLDVIDGWLTEVNVTSPTTFPAIEKLAGIPMQAKLFDFIEKKLKRNKR
jgi:glutathione synthase